MRAASATTKGLARREDYEYKHNGSCNLFVVYEVGHNWRKVKVTRQRRARDFGLLLKELVDEVYSEAETVRIVCDNLNIHHSSSLYAALDEEEAHRLKQKVEFHYTPKHASWLNMVEIENSVLKRKCLDRRMGEQSEVEAEVTVWEAERNEAGVGIVWQFTTEKARTKMASLYAKVKAQREAAAKQAAAVEAQVQPSAMTKLIA